MSGNGLANKTMAVEGETTTTTKTKTTLRAETLLAGVFLSMLKRNILKNVVNIEGKKQNQKNLRRI